MYFDWLSRDALYYLLEYLEPKDAARLSQTSWKLYHICDNQKLWFYFVNRALIQFHRSTRRKKGTLESTKYFPEILARICKIDKHFQWKDFYTKVIQTRITFSDMLFPIFPFEILAKAYFDLCYKLPPTNKHFFRMFVYVELYDENRNLVAKKNLQLSTITNGKMFIFKPKKEDTVFFLNSITCLKFAIVDRQSKLPQPIIISEKNMFYVNAEKIDNVAYHYISDRYHGPSSHAFSIRISTLTQKQYQELGKLMKNDPDHYILHGSSRSSNSTTHANNRLAMAQRFRQITGSFAPSYRNIAGGQLLQVCVKIPNLWSMLWSGNSQEIF